MITFETVLPILYVTPSDWTDRQAVQRAVHAGKKEGAAVDTLDITDLVM